MRGKRKKIKQIAVESTRVKNRENQTGRKASQTQSDGIDEPRRTTKQATHNKTSHNQGRKREYKHATEKKKPNIYPKNSFSDTIESSS